MAEVLIPEEVARQFTTELQRLASAVQTIAIGKRHLRPHAAYVMGPTGLTVPNDTKSFNIVNLGLNGANQSFESVAVSGIAGITEILPVIRVFGFTIENDLDTLQPAVTVTPAEGHIVLIQYLI